MRRENILPPPEPTRINRTEVSVTEKRRRLAQRDRAGVKFLLLCSLASAIGWWLMHA
ncbi:MAG: hypothetical protein AAF236_16445 [Verrucomicrobiota bacterium]